MEKIEEVEEEIYFVLKGLSIKTAKRILERVSKNLDNSVLIVEN